MFDINLGEFSIIAVIAVLVIGPQRLPHYAQQIGRFVREARRMAMGLRDQVRDEMGPEFDDVDWRKLDPRQYDPRRIIREALTEAWEEDGDDAGLPDDETAARGTAPVDDVTDASAPVEGGAPGTPATSTAPAPFDVEAT